MYSVSTASTWLLVSWLLARVCTPSMYFRSIWRYVPCSAAGAVMIVTYVIVKLLVQCQHHLCVHMLLLAGPSASAPVCAQQQQPLHSILSSHDSEYKSPKT